MHTHPPHPCTITFTGVAIGPLCLSVFVVCRVHCQLIQFAGLQRAVIRVVLVKHVADVTEEARWGASPQHRGTAHTVIPVNAKGGKEEMADTRQLRRRRILAKTWLAKTAEEDLQIEMLCNLMKWLLSYKLIKILLSKTAT